MRLYSLAVAILNIPCFKWFKLKAFQFKYYYLDLRRFKTVHFDDSLAPYFPCVLTPETKECFLSLLEKFSATTEVRYFLANGSLIGAMLFRGFIPWDDDIDIFCFAKDYECIKNACLHSSELGWYDVKRKGTSAAKVFFKKSAQEKNSRFPWQYPFIDIFFLEDINKQYFRSSSNGLWYKKSWFNTALLMDFEGQKLPCPENPEMVVLTRHKLAFKYAIPKFLSYEDESSLIKEPLYIKVPLLEMSSLYPILKETLNQ